MMVSLVVSTRNRANRLAEFFASLGRLQPPAAGWELVLVDNRSTDGTAEAIRAFARAAPFAVRCVYAAAPGLSRARNAGLSHAAGRIVAFTDDDCYPQPDFLLAIVDVFERHRPGVLGGRVVLHDGTDARVGVKEAPAPFEIAPRTFVRPGVMHGANMAVRRDVLDDIGGFDPLLGAGTPCMAGEDTDFIARAVWAGWTARYDPRPVVAHHHGRKPGAAADRQRQAYDRGRGAYYAKWALDGRARRTYLREWYGSMRRMARKKDTGPFRREVAGASRYLADRLLHAEPVPRFDRAESSRDAVAQG
jgi:glycosyltransferase involved in cell wall biosynthesis